MTSLLVVEMMSTHRSWLLSLALPLPRIAALEDFAGGLHLWISWRSRSSECSPACADPDDLVGQAVVGLSELTVAAGRGCAIRVLEKGGRAAK